MNNPWSIESQLSPANFMNNLKSIAADITKLSTNDYEKFNNTFYEWIFSLNISDSSLFSDDKTKNSELLDKFIIYLSVWLNSKLYYQEFINKILLIDDDNSDYKAIRARYFDKKILDKFYQFVEYIKKNKANISQQFDNDNNLWKWEINSDIFQKWSNSQQSFLTYIQKNISQKAVAISFLSILFANSLFANMLWSNWKEYRNEAMRDNRENLFTNYHLLSTSFGELSEDVSSIYYDLSQASVYTWDIDLEQSNIQDQIISLTQNIQENQYLIEAIKNDQSLIDVIMNELQSRKNPVDSLYEINNINQKKISELSEKNYWLKDIKNSRINEFMKWLTTISIAMFMHESWSSLDRLWTKWIKAINKSDWNGKRSVWLYQANWDNPQKKINANASTANKKFLDNKYNNIPQLPDASKQVLWYFGHATGSLWRHVSKTVNNIQNNWLLDRDNVDINFSSTNAKWKNVRKSILWFVLNHGSKYNIDHMIQENLPNEDIMLAIMSWAANEYTKTNDPEIANFIKVIIPAAQVWCMAIWTWTIKNINKITNEVSAQLPPMFHAEKLTPKLLNI